jgi:hypothetical protein
MLLPAVVIGNALQDRLSWAYVPAYGVGISLLLVIVAYPFADLLESFFFSSHPAPAQNLDDSVCWFCKADPGDGKPYKVSMYLALTEESIFMGTRFTWKTVTIDVPRCRNCQGSAAARMLALIELGERVYLAIGTLAAIAIFFSLLSFLWGGPRAGSGWVLFLVVPVILATCILALALIERGRRHVATFPAVKYLLDAGWKFGSYPG